MTCRSLIAALVSLLLVSTAWGREEEPRPTRPKRPGEAELVRSARTDVTRAQIEAVERALDYLADHQNPDGSWNEENPSNIAVTSLVLLAMMANGNTETRGKHHVEVQKGVQFLLDKVQVTAALDEGIPAGYIHEKRDTMSRMHGQGYATTVLALAYGMGDRERDPARKEYMRSRLELAVQCIEKAQHESGGWWYQPTAAKHHEGSITVCQIQALRAAREAGVKVNKSVIDRAIVYMERSQGPDGGFCYSLSERQRRTYALTAAALSTLFGLGEYDRTDMIRKGLGYMRDRHGRPMYMGRQGWFFYANFYAAQSLWQASADQRLAHFWREWWPGMRDFLIDSQRKDNPEATYYGSWTYTAGTGTLGVGRVYATAMCTLILEVPLSILPMFQR